MDDFDFVEGMTKKHASPFENIKNLVRDNAHHAVNYVKTNPHVVGGALIGGALASGGTYLVSRKGENGKSPDQEFAEGLVKRTSDKPGFANELAKLTANSIKNVADLAAKYPGAAAAAAVPTGMTVGQLIAKKLLG